MAVHFNFRYRRIWLLIVLGTLLASNIIYSQDLASLKDTKPITISGNFGISSFFYDVDGRDASHKPFTWLLNGSPTLTIYGIVCPFTFTISEEEREFRQPFNKFGVSPYYKWAKLHLGYRNIQFSQYTLAGHSVLGAGLELTPGKLRFGFMAGRFLRAIPNKNPADLGTQIATPSYERNGYSIKLGYGGEFNFIDLILLKGKDDPNSIDNQIGLSVTPAENAVLSVVTKQKINNWVAFNIELAQSAYTRDIRLTTTDSVFKGASPGIFKNFMDINATTVKGIAIDGNIEFNYKKYLLLLRYKRIDPDFKSMGAYYFQGDIQNITIEPTVKLNDDKLILNASLGFQRDNLKRGLEVQTNRTIGSMHVTYQPFNFYQADVTYSNYDLGQKSSLIAVDTLAEISQTLNNIMFTNSFNFASEKITNSFIIIWNYQDLNDRNSNTANQTEFSSAMLSASWYFSQLKTGINGGITFNNTTFKQDTLSNRYIGPAFNLGKTFFGQKISISLSWAFTKYITNNTEISRINTLSIRSALRLHKNHRFHIRYALNNNSAKTISSLSYKENKGEISYVYSF